MKIGGEWYNISMQRLEQTEIYTILQAYGFSDLGHGRYLRVEPDTDLYLFRNKKQEQFVLIVTDYFGDMSGQKLPQQYQYDFGHPYTNAAFLVTKIFSYMDGATVAAQGYLDDAHYWTKTKAGDLCMLCQIEELQLEVGAS